MLQPRSASSPMTSKKARRATGSTPLVGSSSSKMAGSCSTAAASARLRCTPVDRERAKTVPY
jgi:hypothetical protein